MRWLLNFLAMNLTLATFVDAAPSEFGRLWCTEAERAVAIKNPTWSVKPSTYAPPAFPLRESYTPVEG